MGHTAELAGVAGRLDSPVHRLDPRAKLLGLLAVVAIAVSTPLHGWPVLLACAAALAVLAVLARVPARELWRRSRLVLLLVLAAAAVVPFVQAGGDSYELGPLTAHAAGLTTLGEVAARAAIGVSAAALLAATTSVPAILVGLERLRVPRLLVLIAGLTYRYLFVVAAEVSRMRAAAAARGHRPRHLLRAGLYGRLAAALFLRTHARGERVYGAMLARGYEGRTLRLTPLSFGRVDALFVVALVALLLPARLLV